jgi:hypothetical protein
MKKLLIFMLLLTSMGCFGQFKKLKVIFAPSFLEYSNVVIVPRKAGYSLTISNNSLQETCRLDDASMAELNRFLVDYNQKKLTEDSIENARLQEMWAKGGGEITLDGIGVSISLVDKKGTTSISVKNPKKGSIDQAFMRILFKLMNDTFKYPQTVNYVEELEGYFFN